MRLETQEPSLCHFFEINRNLSNHNQNHFRYHYDYHTKDMDSKALVSDSNKDENKGSKGKGCDGSKVVDNDVRRLHTHTFVSHLAV